jgi:hypothetical protein
MKVKVIKAFYDRTADLVLREKGTELETTDERAKELISIGFATEVEPEQAEETTEPEQKKPAKKSGKKTD